MPGRKKSRGCGMKNKEGKSGKEKAAPKLNTCLGKDRFRVLASGERMDRIVSGGVTLNGVTHHFHVISPDFEGDPADLIIMAVKDPELDQATEDL